MDCDCVSLSKTLVIPEMEEKHCFISSSGLLLQGFFTL